MRKAILKDELRGGIYLNHQPNEVVEEPIIEQWKHDH